MTRNKYAALSFIPVTAARHDFGDAERRKRNLAFSFVFRTMRGRTSIEQWRGRRRRRMTQPASSWHCRSGYMMLTDAAAAPNNQIQLIAAVSVTWNPFSAPSLPPARCQLIFCARSTFKALNIIHYNAVHSRLPALLLAECGKCRIRTLLSPLCFWPGGSRSHVLKSRGMYS